MIPINGNTETMIHRNHIPKQIGKHLITKKHNLQPNRLQMFGPKRRNLAPASSFQSDTWGRDQVVSHAGAFGVGPLVGQGMPKRCFRVLSLVLRGPGATFPIFDRGICNRVFPFVLGFRLCSYLLWGCGRGFGMWSCLCSCRACMGFGGLCLLVWWRYRRSNFLFTCLNSDGNEALIKMES